MADTRYQEGDLLYMKWRPRQRGPMRNKYQVRDQFQLVVFKGGKSKKTAVPATNVPAPCDWFKPGVSCYAAVDIGYEGRPRTARCKARILGTSKTGKVWILASLYQRGPQRKMIYEWELRLVLASQLSPLDSGINHPPDMPGIWRKQLGVMSFDTQRLAIV